MKWSHCEMHTHAAGEHCDEHLCQSSHRCLAIDTQPSPHIWEILGPSVTPKHQHADCVGELCRHGLPACLHVLLCSSAVSLWHLSPEGTSNPITDLNKGNGSKASIPLILGSQGEQKSFLSTLQGLQRIQRSQYL